MKIRISELMDFYEAKPYPMTDPHVITADRIEVLTMQKLGLDASDHGGVPHVDRKLLSKAFGEIDENYISEANRPVPKDGSDAEERIRPMKKKRIITFALAAALILALGITAYAAWSIHAARQEQLRAELNITENSTSGYVEYEVSEGPEGGLDLLSAASDGKEQRIYVNIFPVSEEEAGAYMDTVWYGCSIDGTTIGGNAVPVLPIGQAVSGPGEMNAAVLGSAYDAETQTMTLQCFLDVNSLLQAMQYLGTETVPLSVQMYKDGVLSRSFGPVPFSLTEEQLRVFDFGHVLYHDEELDKDIEIVGLDLTPFGAVWKLHYESDAELQGRKYVDFEAYRPWCELEDKVLREAKIVFSDGTEFSTGASLNSNYENGTVNLWISWLKAIDIDDVQRIVLGDLVLWEAE